MALQGSAECNEGTARRAARAWAAQPGGCETRGVCALGAGTAGKRTHKGKLSEARAPRRELQGE